MKEKSLIAAFILCLSGIVYILAGVASSYTQPIVQPVTHKYSSIVRFVDNGMTFCTGTVISRSLILTAAHCVVAQYESILNPYRSSIGIRPISNKNIHRSATVLFANPRMDQALVTGDFSDFEVRPVITDPNVLSGLVKQKTRFISCGYPFNGALFCTTTVFSEVQDFFWAVDGTVLPGMSGGPTMLPDGTVVAINIAVSKDKSIVSPIYNLFNYIPRSK